MPTSTAAWSRCDIGTFSTMIHLSFIPRICAVIARFEDKYSSRLEHDELRRMIELETPLTNTFHRIQLPLLSNTRHLEVALILRNARTIGKFILDEKGFKLSIIFNISLIIIIEESRCQTGTRDDRSRTSTCVQWLGKKNTLIGAKHTR